MPCVLVLIDFSPSVFQLRAQVLCFPIQLACTQDAFQCTFSMIKSLSAHLHLVLMLGARGL